MCLRRAAGPHSGKSREQRPLEEVKMRFGWIHGHNRKPLDDPATELTYLLYGGQREIARPNVAA